MSVHVFGIRHHGPGSARSLRAVLTKLEPDVVLVEGPPDAEAVLPLVAHAAMKPPVALLVYAADTPSRAVFYPLATFSPEWQAITYALARGTPMRFMDLPQAHQLHEGGLADEALSGEAAVEPYDDPLGSLAKAAGYEDRELWWEHQIEQRRDPAGVFEGIVDAMAALRGDAAPRTTREAQREAFMRRTIRAAEKEGFARIAVVCGAWHAPVLTMGPGTPSAKSDDALLKGLPKTKVEATFIPWTHARLAYRSGYGAGVEAPGWYAHLWESHASPAVTWIAKIARFLREAGIDASSASVIETVRLADALAAMRGLAAPGLVELTDATQTVLCGGERAPLALLRSKLEIGDDLGEVPEETPAVPLQRDLAGAQKRLRMKPSTAITPLELDLRNENDRARSCLLHRLQILDVAWGTPARVSGNRAGTFHEHWSLAWRPESALSLVEASVFGTTIASAAMGKIAETSKAADLPALTALLDKAILAELPEAVVLLLRRVQDEAAVSADVRHLMDSLAPLARTARYGSVRETRADQLTAILDGLFERIAVGLVPACASLDDDAATVMRDAVARVHESLGVLDRRALRDEWTSVLHELVGREAIHGLVRGGACRLLVDEKSIGADELERLARRTLSPVTPPAQAAAWAEGLLRGSALLLLHHDGVWRALDEWLTKLSEDAFTEMLPLLRRAFAGFGPAERRQMGVKVKALGRDAVGAGPSAGARSAAAQDAVDAARAAKTYPVLSLILGVEITAS